VGGKAESANALTGGQDYAVSGSKLDLGLIWAGFGGKEKSALVLKRQNKSPGRLTELSFSST
jgi:hypothetical protein